MTIVDDQDENQTDSTEMTTRMTTSIAYWRPRLTTKAANQSWRPAGCSSDALMLTVQRYRFQSRHDASQALQTFNVATKATANHRRCYSVPKNRQLIRLASAWPIILGYGMLWLTRANKCLPRVGGSLGSNNSAYGCITIFSTLP